MRHHRLIHRQMSCRYNRNLELIKNYRCRVIVINKAKKVIKPAYRNPKRQSYDHPFKIDWGAMAIGIIIYFLLLDFLVFISPYRR
jgi:hypothetical protein